MVKTYSQLFSQIKKTLCATDTEQDAAFVARELLCYHCGKTKEEIILHRDEPLPEQTAAEIEFAANRYLQGEPLAYLLGQWEFYGLPLYVDKNVLIPRDDTCAVVSSAINHALFLDKAPRILDLCTGSGCIGLAIASRVKDARVTLADISKDALAVAKKNIVLNHMTGRVSCYQADALHQPPEFLGKFDMIVSNPPYITTKEMEELPVSVADYEPHMALHGGDDGLVFYRAIAKKYTMALKPGGYLAFEFGMGQGDAVAQILEQNQYTILERTRDYNGRERSIIAQYGRKEDEHGYKKDSL